MNNDRFRFRAWDKRNKRMTGPSVCWPSNELMMISPYNDFVIMQCTGLKDSEGTLIWEGDIVEAPALELGAICAVYWDVFFSGWRIRTSTGLSTGLTTFGGAYSPKVIGNIYENPELLEGK